MSKKYNDRNKEMVEEILQKSEKARNSDVYGAIQCCLHFFPDKFFDGQLGMAVYLKDLVELPINAENFKRIRAKFNEVGLYISSDPEVRKQRRQKEIDVKAHLRRYNVHN